MSFFAHRTALGCVLGLALLFVFAADAQTCTSFSLAEGAVYLKLNGSGPGVTLGGPAADIAVNDGASTIALSFGSGAPMQIPTADASQSGALINDLCSNLDAAFPFALRAAAASGPLRLGLTLAAASGQLRPAGQAPQNTVVADFNGDGVPDTATLSTAGIMVTLYHSDGTVLAQNSYPYTGLAQNSLITADFNGDGKPDLAAMVTQTGGSAGSVIVLIGNGDGTFSNPAIAAPGIYPTAIAVGDFNGDGKPDIAVAGTTVVENVISNALAMLIGKGDGTFLPPLLVSPFANVQSMVAADMNGDGKMDLLAIADLTVGSSGLAVILGNGDGNFQSPLYTELPLSQPFLAYADLNNDGKIDAILVQPDQAALYVVPGNGNGTFQPPVVYAAPANADSVGLIPLGDGSTALFLADELDKSTVITFADSTGVVGLPLVRDAGPTYPSASVLTSVIATDLNRDGKPDLVITSPADITVGLNQDNGAFSLVSYPTGGGAVMSAVADVTGDLHPDVLFTTPTGVGVLINQGSGAFSAGPSTPLNNPGLISLADFNADSRIDFAALTGSSVAIMLGVGDGTFMAGKAISLPAAGVGLVTGDFNNDGHADLITSYATSGGQTASVFYPGKGDGSFGSPITLPINGQVMAAADLNADGNLDVVVYNSQTGQLSVLPGAGDGTFESAIPVSIAYANISSVTIADVNGDGKPDLVLGACCGFAEPSVLLGNGDGTFGAQTFFLAGTDNPASVAAANFTGSGMGLVAAGEFSYAGRQGTFSLFYSTAASARVQSSANPNLTAIAPGSLASAFGTDLAVSSPGSTSLPLPTNDVGTTVAIRDSTGATNLAPLLYVTSTQINFEVPSAVAPGPATLTISTGDGHVFAVSTTVAAVAPGIFTLNSSGLVAADVVLFSGDTQTPEKVYTKTDSGSIVANPVILGGPTDQAYLMIFGTGLQAAGKAGVQVTIGGLNAPVHYAGPQGQFVGLDQVNVQIPAALAGQGNVVIQVTVNGIAANPTNMTIQ